MLLKAINFAAQKHRDQRRKDSYSTPYINHPIGVAYILTSYGVENVDVLQAAILHDTVEDTDATIEEIAELFGTRVSDMVAEVTDDRALAKVERKEQQVLLVASKSDGAKMIKLADKLYNLRDLAKELPIGWTEERRVEYYNWAKLVVSQITGINDELEVEIAKQLELFCTTKETECSTGHVPITE